MAKKLVTNYVFSPGKGLQDNLYPNAYSLISQNKVFLQQELVAFTQNQVADAVKCERDLGYIIDAAGFDITLGTNYNAVFQGLAEYNSNEITGTVIRTIQRARDQVLALSNVLGNATATTRATTYFNEIVDIAQNGRSAADIVTFTNPSDATTSRIAAKDKLIANINFITAEINAYVAVNYPAYNHDVAKCTRDVQYAVRSFAYDILYGGNSATYDNAKFFFYFDPVLNPGIDPTHKAQTVDAYERLAIITESIVQGILVTPSSGNSQTQITVGDTASAGDASIIAGFARLIKNTVDQGVAFINAQSKTLPSVTWSAAGLQSAKSQIDSNKTTIINAVNGFANYTFNETKCFRDSGYVIDALLFDLRYGGNEETRRVSTFYWNGNVPQIDGSRLAEYESYYFWIDTINNFILTNTLDTNPEQNSATQVIDLTKTAEAGTTSRVSTLLQGVINVIQNGLGSLPALVIGLGRVELLDKIDLQDLLIITNVTDNFVIYNFAEPTKGGQVRFTQGNSEAYPQAFSVSNGTTIINFISDTSSMSSSDEIQIFLEDSELRVRLNDIATDAMERVKVALPQAMLDADFEYGLQPTKWQAISLQRGYPSTYEIPASDILVTNVVTDASAGTSGVGASLITVTTTGVHGFKAGEPFTIRALASSITGFNRAEGTFLVQTVPTTSSFTYFAKAKVGTTNGQVLATSTTQLRKAGFYTGSNVGTATFSVASQGSSGSFTTALRAPTSSTTLTFVGAAPPIGAPLVGTGIPLGTQVSGTYGGTNINGIIASKFVSTGFTSGGTSIDLVDASGVSTNMVVSSRDVTPVQRIITSVVGNTLNLNGAINANYRGDIESYPGIVIGQIKYIQGTGINATFNVTVTSGEYTAVSVAAGGSGYLPGDLITISGANLGGTAGDNDLRLNVLTVTSGAVSTVEIIFNTGVNGIGTGTFNGVASTVDVNERASNCQLTITRNAAAYSLSITSAGNFYLLNNRFKVLGTDLSGATPANDAIVTITGVSNGNVTSASITGTAIRGEEIDIYAAVSLSQATSQQTDSGLSVTYSSIPTIQVDFAENHGFVPGASILVQISSSGGNHGLAAGPYFINEIVDLNTIRYIARSPGTIDTTTNISGVVYIRPDAFFSHRPFDGGVQLGTGGPQHGAHAVRMSKKYIRYQSGKGAMYNTGALFAPSFDIGSITATGTASGSLITVATDDVDHGLQAGAIIRLTGVDTVGYNGEYTVNEIIDERTFRVTAQEQLGATSAIIGSQCQMALVNWHGAIVRSGPFDDQNGIFWQYDGNELSVGRRTSTFQIAGTAAMTRNGSLVTGTNTRFLDQLQEGDRIVIRGMTHVVTNITSNTSMTVTPGFRGTSNVTGVKIAKVQDLIIPQSEWNLDKCDGTGPSGYLIDITKMQMIGIQFTWYGAGFIDWMLRGPDGNYVFCHRLKGNNLNTEAYMRTGNLPVRYEVINESARSRLDGSINSSQTSIKLVDVSEFPVSGSVYIDNECISYTGRNLLTNQLTGCTRATTLVNFAAGSTRTYQAGAAASHNDRQGVVLISSTTSPIISHWGSAYLIDGLFDEDRGYIFSYGATNVSISTTKVTAFLIRLAPSVSNAVIGDLGERELLNRAQLLLNSVTVTSDGQATADTGGIVVEGILNPQNYPLNPSDIQWNGLASLSAGGQPSFAQIAPGGSVSWSGGASETLATATTTAQLTETVLTPNFGNTFGNNSSFIYVARSSWESSNVHVPGNNFQITPGVICSGGQFRSGTTITSVNGPFGSYYEIQISQTLQGNIQYNGSTTFSFVLGGTSVANTSTLFFTSASWDSSGAVAGTEVSDTKFPANTRVSQVSNQLTFGATTYRRVTFTQTSLSSTSAGGTVQFRFGQPPYAQPGETVFSLVSNPGETSTLELGQLKELTTTAIGGRGAFPNGPDVLAINVYKVSGTATKASILLRWGEAQA